MGLHSYKFRVELFYYALENQQTVKIFTQIGFKIN